MSTAAVEVACRAEDKVRLAAAIKPSRVIDYFRDFDRLRSGRVSSGQFQRCLSQHFAVNLTSEEFQALCDKYRAAKSQNVDYERFAHCVKGPQDTAPIEAMYPSKTTRHSVKERDLYSESVEVWEILNRCQNFFEQHAVNVKVAFQETGFDRHNRGYITDAQFRRAFPGPRNMISEEEIELLIARYRNPATKLVNYVEFHNDVQAMQEARRQPEEIIEPQEAQPLGLSKEAHLSDVLARIRDAVYHNRIRSTEFFVDYDRHNHGIVTDNQFICGLMLCCGKQAHLNRQDTQLLVEHFRQDAGRVNYRQFCHLLEHTYMIPDLDKKPTQVVYRPTDGELAKTFNTLTINEEQDVEELLSRLRSSVDSRQLMTYPLFKDFDWSGAYTRGITAPQFRRMLDYVSLQVSEPEFKLLCRKYRNERKGDINYTAFLQAVDSGYVAHVGGDRTVDLFPPKPPSTAHWSTRGTPYRSPAARSFEEIMARLKDHVLRNQVRVTEHFEDFDPKRSGTMTCEQFKRCLDSIGMRPLLVAEADVLCAAYADKSRTDRKCVLWKRFQHDIDEVFTRSDLLQNPTASVAPENQFIMPPEESLTVTRKPAGRRTQSATFAARDNHVEKRAEDKWISIAEEALVRMREQVSHRNLLPRPVFQDFDVHHLGHITARQFRQGLSALNLEFSEDEAHALELKYGDKLGIHFTPFVEEIDPPAKYVDKYRERLDTIKSLQELKASRKPMKPAVAAVLDKMRTKVIKDRVRTSEFMRDFDRFRTGRFTRNILAQTLDLCGFNLKPEEMAALQDYYADETDPSKVVYTQLCEDMEVVFTEPNLEKTPLKRVEQMELRDELAERRLEGDDNEVLDDALKVLAQQMVVRHLDLFPPFEDFDRLKIGYVTQAQFFRVMNQLGLAGCTAPTWWDLLLRRFRMDVGGRRDFNYLAFAHTLNQLADVIHGVH
eukprot:scpid16142/ scgid5850/ 